ncbi:glycosyltransferase family 2 protein [Candidatus Peregrinibacteria bacterium CG10_big_fil_rev_8_21_14_0_10_55_24]|nr:MAG: glycosyltransferase family 2 protein [Candidatus Peregrinibacteria bacterium CG10_big_fil_rev_8_21_14_0_10_55_24]
MNVVAVIPAFNEETRITDVIHSAFGYVSTVIVVDDASADATAVRAQEAGALVLQHMENSGAGAATMTGVEAARALHADAVVTLDADGQHDPHDIAAMLKPVEEGRADIVFANRFGQRNSIPLIRRLANAAGNLITFAATGRWVHDSQCGFKVFGPRAVRQLTIRMSGFEFCTEIVRESVQHRWRIAQVPTKVLYSPYTMAKGQSFAKGIETALKILLRSFLR